MTTPSISFSSSSSSSPAPCSSRRWSRGLWLVRVGLRPLGWIEVTAAAIAGGDLSQRVDNDDQKTEVGRLGGALNTMLG
ncbi:MAG: HAMP domain-containing protein, partial [Thermoleophilia bacterium]|nr:HAMP domain-containing protein [Thermoleophilia bacterium]